MAAMANSATNRTEMVFEKYVVQLLDKYLSNYIENVDYKKLKIDMWSGNVELVNLHLKPNALADLHLPVIIKLGCLQKLTLQIPWKNLYTHPTKVTINGLYIVVIPKLEVEYNGKQEEDDRYKTKMKEVERIEQLHQETEEQDQTKKVDDTFGARMKLQIIQNLQLSIHNIHIVYEDRTTKPNHPFSFGITLNSMTFQTTNSEWKPTVMKENTPINYKLGELNALSVYWNTDSKPNSNEIIKTLQSKIAVDQQHLPSDMSYIFQPFNIQAKLIMILKPRQQNFEQPMFRITIDLQQISLNLTRSQYLDILDFLEYQDYTTAKLKYIKYRPKKFQNSKEKWQFAYTAIVNEIIKPRVDCYKWKNIQMQWRYFREYRTIYLQALMGKITNEQKLRAEVLERNLNVFNITYIRRRAQLEAKKKKEQEPKNFRKAIANWWNKKSDSTDSNFDLNKLMSDEEQKELYRMIGYEGEDTSTSTYPKEYIDIDLTVRLLVLDVNIWSTINANDRQLQSIVRAVLPNVEFNFRRRPATSSALFCVNLGSFQVFGCANQPNEIPPVLIRSIVSTDSKLLQVEFAINPTDKDSGYRLQMLSQSVEIKYHMPTIDKLVRCFRNDTSHNLKGVKQVALDMKYQSIVLLKQNVENAKVLDIYIDLQSSYFILPENGIYYDGCPVLCLDMGHLVFQQNRDNPVEHYIQYRLELKKFQLLYANHNENWQIARTEQNSRLHLIEPITLNANILKCSHFDRNQLAPWKMSGRIPDVNLRISDMRLFRIIRHLQSFSLPQLETTDEQETPIWTTASTELTLETLADLTEERTDNFTQFEGSFELSQINLVVEEAKNEKENPFLRISLVSMRAQMLVKTVDIEFQASLNDLIIFHEQFITKNKQHLRLLAAQPNLQSQKLVEIHVLHTSSDDGKSKNKVRVHLSKFVLALQLEALLSILRFQDNITQKWPTEQTMIEKKPQENELKRLENSASLEIEADLEEFRVALTTITAPMFDVSVQGIKGKINHSVQQTAMNLSLNDFCLLDPNTETRYSKIISQQTAHQELLSISMILYNYPKKHIKSLTDVDCDVQIHSTKVNIVLIYKHINQLLEFIDILSISQAAVGFATTPIDAVYEQIQKLQDQAFKLRLKATFNAPTIFIPMNSTSDEGLFLDLGQLTVQTKFLDDLNRLLVEQQEVMIENVRASHARVNKSNEIQSEISLLECAKLQMNVDRLLYHEQAKNKPYISIKMHWDFVHFRLTRDDYVCLMRIVMENFDDQIIPTVNREQYGYRQVQQKQEEEDLRKAVINKQTGWQIGEVLEKIRVYANIQKVALTLYLGESNLIERRVQHVETSKLANIAIERLEFIVHRASDESYKFLIRMKNALCDDLRETHRADTITRVIDRHHTVDPNEFMLVATLEYKPKNEVETMNQRTVHMQLESLYICLKIDYLMILYDFFIASLPTSSSNQISESKTAYSNSNADVQSHVNILVKNPEIVLLEHQQQPLTNCLGLNLGLTARISNVGSKTHISGDINDLTIFSSKFSDVRDSKIKYRILHPTKAYLSIGMDTNVETVNVQISDIFVNIAPAAVRIVMTVIDTLNNHQKHDNAEKFDVQTMFEPKPLSERKFWFLREKEGKGILGEKSKQMEKNVSEQFLFTLKTIEIKVDLEFGAETKSVAAMCLSNWVINLSDWSNQMTLLSTMQIEAALYNEHTLTWEPFIEPVVQGNAFQLAPWKVSCSIEPIEPSTTEANLQAKQLISLRSEDYLNITITKTGFDLLNYLLTVFGNFHKQNLPTSADDQPALSLLNATGRKIFISDLHGLTFTDNSLWTSTVLEENASISLTTLVERSVSAHRLSVLEEQTTKNRQDFLIQIDDAKKSISINRTWQRVYNLSTNPPMQILCDTQVQHNRRRVILSSIVKIRNETNFPMLIINLDWVICRSDYQLGSYQDFYVPIDLLTQNSSIFISMDDIVGDQPSVSNDVLIFDWQTNQTQEEEIQLKTGHVAHLVLHKETREAYAENTDQLDQISYCIYIHAAIQLTNLLPMEMQCVIQNKQRIILQPNQMQLMTSANKNSLLQFVIPSFDQQKWVSEPIDLKKKYKTDTNERIVNFYYKDKVLRVILLIKIHHGALNLTIYTPFWLLNHTNRKLEFQIGHEKMPIGNINQAFIICPEKYKSDSNEKCQIRLDEPGINWSEKFSLDVIKSTGMASCKGLNDKTYMVCVDIATSSFGLTKIITLSPAMVVVNQTSIALEIMETVGNREQNKWQRIEPNGGVIPFWPQNAKDSVMYVRYAHSLKISRAFSMKNQHQTLLYMYDPKHLVIFVEVSATDFDGVRVIFTDYKSGDAPLLIVNHTKNHMISFVQKDEKEIQYLVPEQFVYYTWRDPLKPREIIATCNEKPKIIELHPHRGILDETAKCEKVEYVVFIDGLQTVLLITDNEQMIEMALDVPSSTQSISRRIQVGLPNVGLSMVNDRTREELMYISLIQSKVQWVQMRKSHQKPLPAEIQIRLERIYNNYPGAHNKDPNSNYREIILQGETAELITRKGQRIIAKRQSLYGLWVDYTWSATHAALYASIYRAQIDNQLDHTSYPSMLYPVLPKTADTILVDKPFIEFSMYETKHAQSNVRHIQYCKLLIQEFALRIEQGLIVAILDFFKEEKNSLMPSINMHKDFEYIDQSLQSLIKAQIQSPSNEIPMFFNNIHLSPLKIHVSFSMHGSKSSEKLFAEYPLVGFLLKTLNVAEVQDVVLRLGFYDRSWNRYTMTKLKNEVLSHYQNQFLKQIHVLILGLDVLGNPLGIIRGLAEGVESLFYEPYKGAIEGPMEFAEGVATGVLTFVGSTVGTTAGAISKITGVIGQSLATLTFDDEYKHSRIRRKETAGNPVTDITTGGMNVVKGFVHGITGVVTKPIDEVKHRGVPGIFTGLGKGLVGVVAKPTGAMVDFASTSLDVIKRTATQEQIVRRIRYPRHVAHDGLVRPYISHEAMGIYILKRLNHQHTGTYIAHFTCSANPPTWLMATSQKFLYVEEISFLDSYDIHWSINYADLQEAPVILLGKQVIQILVQPNKTRPSGKLVKYQNITEAEYFIDKITHTMHSMGL